MNTFTTAVVIAALALTTQAFAMGGGTTGGQSMRSATSMATMTTGSKMSTGSTMSTGSHTMAATAPMIGSNTMNTTMATKQHMTPVTAQ